MTIKKKQTLIRKRHQCNECESPKFCSVNARNEDRVSHYCPFDGHKLKEPMVLDAASDPINQLVKRTLSEFKDKMYQMGTKDGEECQDAIEKRVEESSFIT